MSQNNSTSRLLSYFELMVTLQGLCREKQSGVMVIRPESGTAAQFALEQGVIFDANLGGVNGKEALSLIKKIPQGKVSFFKGSQRRVEQRIELTTPEIFQLLIDTKQTASTPLSQTSATQSTPVSTPTPVVQENIPPVQSQASEDQMVIIEAQLAAIIGPVAKLIYAEFRDDIQRADSLATLSSAIEKISRQVLVGQQQKTFKHSIREFISRCGLKDQSSILNALKSTNRELQLVPTTLALLLAKQAVQGEVGQALANRLVAQLESAGNLAGIVELADVLRFLEKTTKTGLLLIEAKEKKARFCFEQGVLINAVDADKRGVAVALEIMQWQADVMSFISTPQTGVTREIHQTADMLLKQASSAHGIISKQEAMKLTKTALSADDLQNALAKEIERLQGKSTDKREDVKRTEAEYTTSMAKAIHLAESCDAIQAQQLLSTVLINNDDNYSGWFWLARVLTNMTAIEFALKKAAYLNSKSGELIEEVKKFTLAKRAVKRDFVTRCPFCWMPIKEKDHECPYCLANFFIDNAFFSKVGKAKTELLDKAIARYDAALQRDTANAGNIYLHFYLAMAYLNREYYQEGLAQLNEIVKLAPENQALIRQCALLTRFMQTEKLILTPAQQEGQTVTLQKGRILVVEDSMVTRKVIARTLIANGYEVFEAKDAIEALTGIEERNPNLVLLDIILPGKDGYEILAEIRKIPRLAKIPVIMLTSRNSLFDKLKGKVSDANEYLTKPFQPDELLNVVKKYL